MPEAWDQYLAEHEEQHLDELFEYLRIPSISALPQHDADVRRAAIWTAEKLRAAGVPNVELLPTARNPVVFGHWHVDDNQPTAMIYGHYDVQPPDPLDLWESPPFEPTIRDGKIYARGAADDKGNIYMPIKAFEALLKTQGGPKINVKFFIEGEEEIGSPSLSTFVHDQREKLACDYVLCADGGMYAPDKPSVVLSSKGLAGCQVNLRTAGTDLHSGGYGSTIANAAQQVARLVATFHTPDGRVAVEGFYDRVKDVTDEERAEIALVPFDEKEYLERTGATMLWGEPGYAPLERVYRRPTLDINGIWSGFQGEGNKTVTPSQGHFKVTCRLVPDQDPDEILDLIEQHVKKHAAPQATVTIDRSPGSARPFSLSPDHPALNTARAVLRELYGTEPLAIRQGGTLPVANTFQQELGANLIFFSFGMPDSRVHAPNEAFRLDSFKMAPRAYCAYLNALAR